MATETVRAMDPEVAPMGEFSRLVGVFFEPKKTFRDIAERPHWLAPLVIIMISSALLVYLFNSHVGWEAQLHRMMDNNPRVQQMAPEQRQNLFNLQLRFAPISAFTFGVLFVPLTFLAGGGIILGIVKGLLGVPIRFAQVFAIMAYGWLPRVIYAGLSIIVMFLKNPEDFDLQNAFASNPGAFMDPDTGSKFLYSLASAVDLFSLWVILLIATGLKVAGGKRISFGGALFAVVLPWAVLTLFRASLAAVGIGG